MSWLLWPLGESWFYWWLVPLIIVMVISTVVAAIRRHRERAWQNGRWKRSLDYWAERDDGDHET